MEFVHGFVLDGSGGATEVSAEAVRAGAVPEGVLWLHLDYAEPETAHWMRSSSGLDEVSAEALLAEDPRPRSLVVGAALLVVLRGINANADADPEDMVSLRVWTEVGRVLTLRHRRVAAVQNIVRQLASGHGPVDAGDLLHDLVDQVLDRIGVRCEALEDAADALEEEVLEGEGRDVRTRLSALRREAISLRRHLVPQRDTIARLHAERVSWLTDIARARLRETADRMARHVEALDSVRERAAVTHEELANRIAEQMNRTMYMLSVVAAIFLPLGLLTGLLGINVGGMPGTDSSWAFLVVTAVLVVLGLVEYAWFRRSHLL